VLNKIELKGPSDERLWGVVVWTDHKPAGSYLYKQREHAVERYNATLKIIGRRQRVTLERIDLVWSEVNL
jgi:hypothetical protein